MQYPWSRVEAVIAWTGQILKVKVAEVVYLPLDCAVDPASRPDWLMEGEWGSVHVRREYQSEEQSGRVVLGRVRVPPACMTLHDATPFLRVSALSIRCFCGWQGALRLGEDMAATFSCE